MAVAYQQLSGRLDEWTARPLELFDGLLALDLPTAATTTTTTTPTNNNNTTPKKNKKNPHTATHRHLPSTSTQRHQINMQHIRSEWRSEELGKMLARGVVAMKASLQDLCGAWLVSSGEQAMCELMTTCAAPSNCNTEQAFSVAKQMRLRAPTIRLTKIEGKITSNSINR